MHCIGETSDMDAKRDAVGPGKTSVGSAVGGASQGAVPQGGAEANPGMMVAPGSGGASHIPREKFEKDPQGYLRVCVRRRRKPRSEVRLCC